MGFFCITILFYFIFNKCTEKKTLKILNLRLNLLFFHEKVEDDFTTASKTFGLGAFKGGNTFPK